MSLISVSQLNDELDDSLWPAVLDIDETEGGVQCRLNVHKKLSYFEGHFPEQAVLPGVVQVHWVGGLAARFFACDQFTALNKTKFSNMILPETTLTLTLKFEPDTGVLNYRYENSEQTFSSGQIQFKPRATMAL